jgi:4-alpha-glucanotransferase
MARSSGILLHISSLPGAYGVGDMGKDAFAFIDFLIENKQQLWQILPVGPTGYGNSPYQSYSAFAGSALFISVEKLVAEGLLLEEELALLSGFSATKVEYDRLTPVKNELLRKAFVRFQKKFDHYKGPYHRFLDEHAWWADDYALFRALKETDGKLVWNEWADDYRKRKPHALDKARQDHAEAINFHLFEQFLFFKQWFELKEYANKKGVRLFGDLPLYVSLDSSDVWANQDLFLLDKKGKPTHVGGVPPDYFSETGQLWGCPVFDWQRNEERGFDWWAARVHFCLKMFDLIRIDHFRGLESFWSVKAGEKTAINGEWVPAKGFELLNLLQSQLGELPVIAEDLGIITPEVEQLRDHFGLPGMKVLQFGYASDETDINLPHNYKHNFVVYTGTHDNDTTRGWVKAATKTERKNLKKYFKITSERVANKLIEAAWASAAEMAILPMQDLMGLDSKGRMNIPGTASGNWEWRFKWEQLRNPRKQFLKMLTKKYNR